MVFLKRIHDGFLCSVCSLSNYNAVDTASAVAIALMTFGTMYPMSVYSGKVLLQVRSRWIHSPTSGQLMINFIHITVFTTNERTRFCHFSFTDDTVTHHRPAGQTAQRGESRHLSDLSVERQHEHYWLWLMGLRPIKYIYITWNLLIVIDCCQFAKVTHWDIKAVRL